MFFNTLYRIPVTFTKNSPMYIDRIAPSLPSYRARSVGGVGDDGGIEPVCTDAPDGARPRGKTQRRTRAQVASVAAAAAAAAASLGVKPQAPGRGTTFGAGCAARCAATAPSPPHLHSTRALSATDPCCCCARAASVLERCACTDGPGIESELISSAARARQGARRKERAPAPIDARRQMERNML